LIRTYMHILDTDLVSESIEWIDDFTCCECNEK
jgi:hypothetical protein